MKKVLRQEAFVSIFMAIIPNYSFQGSDRVFNVISPIG